MRREIKEYYNVLIDDYTVLDEILNHLIEKHNFTRINFLTGPKGFPDSEKRLTGVFVMETLLQRLRIWHEGLLCCGF